MSEESGFRLWGWIRQFGGGKNILVPKQIEVAQDGRLKVEVEYAPNGRELGDINVATMPVLTANPTKHTLLAQQLLGVGSTTVYTVAAGKSYRDCYLFLNNVSAAARTAQVSLGSLDDTHSLAKSFPLAIGERGLVFIPALAAADVVRGLCDSANGVTAELWGVSV